MKKQIDELKKEEEKKSQDAEKRRKEILKSGGSSRYRAPSGSDYSSSRHRDSGRGYDGGSGSGWSPWGGGSDSGGSGRSRSSWGGDSSSSPSSSFGKDADKPTGIKQDTDSSTTPPTTTSPGGTIAGRETEETKDAEKKYTKAVQSYKKALDTITRYTKGDAKDPQIELIDNFEDCEVIRKSIESAKAAKRGISEKMLPTLEKQHNEELRKQENSALEAVKSMLPIALEAATYVDKNFDPRNRPNQIAIKKFLTKTIKNTMGNERKAEYEKHIKDRGTQLVGKLRTDYAPDKIITAVEKELVKIKQADITFGHTGSAPTINHLVLARAYIPTPIDTKKEEKEIIKIQKALATLKDILPENNDDINKISKNLNESKELIDIKNELFDFNEKNRTAAKESNTKKRSDQYKVLKATFSTLKEKLEKLPTIKKTDISNREKLFEAECNKAIQ
jgi:hypothetical protein